MKKVVISRKYQKSETLGTLVVFNDDEKVYECKTLELPEKGNAKNISCIPEGTYDVTKIYSPKRGYCFLVNNVKDRDAILIHSGNYATGSKVDTQGCILVGKYAGDLNGDGEIDVCESKLALSELLNMLPSRFNLTIM